MVCEGPLKVICEGLLEGEESRRSGRNDLVTPLMLCPTYSALPQGFTDSPRRCIHPPRENRDNSLAKMVASSRCIR
jgi:hypothetical protein